MNPGAGPPPASGCRAIIAAAIPLLLMACGSSTSTIATGAPPTEIQLVTHLGGATFSAPLWAQQAPDGSPDWYVVEQAGVIWRTTPAGTKTLFLDISDRVDSGGEKGLLGMAFDPQYPGVGQVYVSYTTTQPGSLTSRISRIPLGAGSLPDPAQEKVLLAIAQPYPNHNGGQIAFGPDGFLYVGLGDGGSADDPENRAQNLGTLLGKMLRLDVRGQPDYSIPAGNPYAGGGGLPEIFAHGLRNPWRWSFDRQTGDLWVADVGQNAWEEVNVVVAGGNYGWRIREGARCFIPANCSTAGLTDPVTEYGHDLGCSVTGGYVYRGAAMPALQGTYLFGDFCSGRIFAVPAVTTGFRAAQVLLESGALISSFAEGRDGELYVVDFNGAVRRIAPKP